MEIKLIETLNPPIMDAWAAGTIEGEGSIVFTNVKGRTLSRRCEIVVSMTDKDVIQKLHRVLGVGTMCGPYKGKNKARWTWSVQNQKGCFDTLLRIMPYLCERRLAKASQMFEFLEGKIDKWI